jgi:predicted regulator of Ras-like GTPase activity (Roadblock/LC7/MglB family)
MDNEVYSFALKTTLNEIQNICPEIKNAFVFKEDGEIVATDPQTSENTAVRVIDAFDGIFEKTGSLGEVEGITLEGAKGRINVSCINDFYFATIASEKADPNYVKTVTKVLIPTILRLIDKIDPVRQEIPVTYSSKPKGSEEHHQYSSIDKDERLREEPVHEKDIADTVKPAFEPEVNATLPEASANQFIVENIGGLLVPSDTVRVDNDLMSSWTDTYGDRKIEEVEIETFGGKTVQCKVRPIKDSKYEGKGIVQIPEKIQLLLEVKKGELVKVKPVVL